MYAKSNPPKTIREHNEELRDNFEILKKYLPADKIQKYEKVLLEMLRLHDFGKANSKFQKKLGIKEITEPNEIKKLKEIHHERLSLAFISKELKKELLALNEDEINIFDVFRYAIALHHTRDVYLDQDDFRAIVKYDLELQKAKLGADYPLQDTINLIDLESKIDGNLDSYLPYLVFFKGILHKCDYAASAEIPCESSYEGNYEEDFANNLDFALRDFQKNAENLRDKSVVLIASTGMGKTEYSMNWIGGDKAFYLLGLRIAVNAMYERFLGHFGKNVALLHGDAHYRLLEEVDSKSDYDYKIAKARQLSCPITVATADQLVTSVFKYNGFELPYLCASYSKIVVDEIQSFAPESIACIVVFLQEIARLGGRFLLMTATLPPFIKKEFADIAHFEEPQLMDMKRHKIEVADTEIEEFDFSKLDSKKVLIICNTVAKAQALYEKLQAHVPNLLHSRFVMSDRKSKEDEILECESGIWITTQIVEASLDIDFDLLLTECATIDSILQRLGRCYRKREYGGSAPNILIFKYDAVSKKIYDPKLLERTFEVLKKHSGVLLGEAQKQEMIEWVFEDIERLNTEYFNKYQNYKTLLKSGFRANKNDAQELFRKISNTHVVIPMPVYEKNKVTIDALILEIENAKGLEKIKLKGRLYENSVSLQIFDDRKTGKLLKDFPLDSSFLKKENLRLLDGVEYSYEKGVEFIKDYKDMDNFIF